MCRKALLVALIGLFGMASLSITQSEENKTKDNPAATEKKDSNNKTDQTAEAKIKDLIKQLGSDDYSAREKAQQELINLGKTAISLVESAVKETNDPEIKNRCDKIIADYYIYRWNRFFVQTLKENKDFYNTHKDLKLDEKALERQEYTRLTDGYLAKMLLTEPICFYYVSYGLFSLCIKPPSFMILGITENCKIVSITEQNLKLYLNPVKTKEEALTMAILIARLIVVCDTCGTPTSEFNPVKCSVEAIKEGGFKVSIPQDAIVPNFSKEAVGVFFDKNGVLSNTTVTEHQNNHQ